MTSSALVENKVVPRISLSNSDIPTNKVIPSITMDSPAPLANQHQIKMKNFYCVFCQDGSFLDAKIFQNHMETVHNMFYEHDILFAINFIDEVEKNSIIETISTAKSVQPRSKYEEELKNIEVKTTVLENDHVESLNVTGSFSCHVCGKLFKRRRKLIQHAYIHTKEKHFITCTYCDKQILKSALKIHTQIHTGEKPHTCPECDQTFSTLQNFESHSYIHGGQKPFKCEQCDKEFALKGNLKRHIRMHTAKKSYNCHQCSKAFLDPYAVKKHMVIHTGVKPYQCQHCSHSFYYKFGLNYHSQKHNELRYACQQCEKTFTHEITLKQHTDNHTVREFIDRQKISVPVGSDLKSTLDSLSECRNGIWTCTVCGKTATTRRNNKSHMRDHTEIHIAGFIYNCQYCGRSVKTSAVLREHHKRCQKMSLQLKTDNTAVLSEHIIETHRTYKCRFCDFSSSSEKGVSVHDTHMHSFKCDYCGSILGDAYHLKTHIREFHETN